jgi:hypothetical protein
MSYGNTWIEGTVSTAVYRMPNPSVYYSDSASPNYKTDPTFTSKNPELLDDAKKAFANNQATTGDSGIVLDSQNYDVIGVTFPDIGCYGAGVKFAGLASVGAGIGGISDLWMQGNNQAKVYVHEMGHVYSLQHSNFWETTDGSVVGNGSEKEYGDIYDVMGGGDVPAGHFHPQAKQKLFWLNASQWADASVNGSGSYRIYRHDDSITTGPLRGVRITKSTNNGGEYYWIGYRAAYPDNPHLQRGAYLLWQRPGADKCCLIDTTPGSAGGKQDAPVDIGRTYGDKTAGVYITPTGQGGQGSDQYLDVQVNLGPFPNNNPPVIANFNGPATAAARSAVSFSITASDPDNDQLSYFWDSGDGFVSGGASLNAASFAHAWTTSGTYTVTVTVSDMKGGSVTKTQQISVDDPAQRFTQQTTPSAFGPIHAMAASDSLLVAVGEAGNGSDTNVIHTSTDGATWVSRPVAEWTGNLKMRSVAWNGSLFVAVGEDHDQDWYGVIYTSPNGLAWKRAYAVPNTGTSLFSIAAGNGIWLAGGNGGTLLRSTDGANWVKVTNIPGQDASHTIEGLAFGNGTFVLTMHQRIPTTDNGLPHVCTSSDGLQWTDQINGTGIEDWQDLRRVAFLNDRFVGSGWSSKLRTSTDNAATFSSTRTVTEEAYVLAYNAGLYFASGVERSKTNPTKAVNLFSTDARTWTQVPVPTSMGTLGAGAVFNSRLVLGGTNGLIWQSDAISNGPSNNAPVINNIAKQSVISARTPATFAVSATDKDGDTLRYFWDAGADSTSNTGQTFTYTWPSGGTYQISVTVSDGRGGFANATQSVQVVDSATTFSPRTSGTNADINGIATSGSLLVAVGTASTTSDKAVIRTSSDGSTWTPRSVTEYTGNLRLLNAIWSGSKFVAVGFDYNTSSQRWIGVIYNSTDGITWVRRHVYTPANTDSYGQIQAVAAGSGVMLAGGADGLLLRSTDNGDNWTPITLGDLPLTHMVGGIAYGSGTFLLSANLNSNSLGANGDARLLVSSDAGQNWSNKSNALLIDLVDKWQDVRGIAFLNDRFVASGWYSKLLVSTDKGTSFTTTRSTSEQTPALAYGNGVYFAGGVTLNGGNNPSTNINLLSMDGVQWNSFPALSSVATETAATFFNNTFVIVGTNGSIWQSGVISAAPAGLEIILPPSNTSVALGGSATFSVVANGQGTLSYQWLVGSQTLPNSNNPKYTINPAKLTDAGSYSVVVTDDFETNKSITSSAALLTVNTPVTISKPPLDQTVTAGTQGSLSVTADGTAPISYQWRKGGVPITNATGAILTFNSILGTDAGSYDVVVTNPCGSVTSAAATITVNLPPSISTAPSNLKVDLGVPFTMSVVAVGTPPFTYEWSKDGTIIANATSPSLLIPSAKSSDAGIYSVKISSPYSTASASASATVTVSSIPGVLLQQQPSALIELIRGSSVSARFKVDTGDGSPTNYQLLAAGTTAAAPNVSGVVGSGGIADVPLRALMASGKYKVRFTRQYPGGFVATTDSDPFNVVLYTWEDAAGTYEALLQTTSDSSAAMGDNAVYRGLLNLNISKSGTFSGRVLYNEAQPIGTTGARYYAPVVRAMSGSFTPVDGDPLKMTASPRLGSASQTAREEIQFELDFSASPPTLKATLKDHVSLPTGNQTCNSQALQCTRLPAAPTDLAKQLAGRYTIVSDSTAPAAGHEHNSYVLVQVLSSMRVLWTSRQAGYSGSGSAGLHTGNLTRPITQFYESRFSQTSTLLNSTSLLGLLSFEQGNDLVWRPTFKSDLLSNGFEKQASYLNVSNKLPTYDSNDTAHSTGVKVIDFAEGRRARWSGSSGNALPTFVPAATVFALSVPDPLQPGTTYTWNVTVSASGVVRATAPSGAAAPPPPLTLRLDRARGEWSGSYTINKARRTLVGSAVDPLGNTGVIGLGWIETGTAPNLSTSVWLLNR